MDQGQQICRILCMAGRYGGFSYAKTEVHNVISYIQNQEAHHKKKAFLEEYRELLEEFEVEYDPLYLFKEME